MIKEEIINKSYLHKRFYFTCKSLQILKLKISLIISISGGQDSLTLLKLICDFSCIYKWKIILVHFNHNTRLDSQNNAYLIEKIAKTFHLEYHLYTFNDIFKESNARLWRYKNLITLAKNKNCTFILTAHTMNDKIETLLANLFRGSGLKGLSTISTINYVDKNIKIIRPIINFTRDETYWFCRCFYLPIWLDLTNFNLNLKRNRIRYEVLPYISRYFNASIYYNLANVIDIISKENEYVQWLTYLMYKDMYNCNNRSLNIELFNKYHISIKRRIIQHFFSYNFNIYLSFEENSQVLDNLNNKIYTEFTIQNKKFLLFFIYEWVLIRTALYDKLESKIK